MSRGQNQVRFRKYISESYRVKTNQFQGSLHRPKNALLWSSGFWESKLSSYVIGSSDNEKSKLLIYPQNSRGPGGTASNPRPIAISLDKEPPLISFYCPETTCGNVEWSRFTPRIEGVHAGRLRIRASYQIRIRPCGKPDPCLTEKPGSSILHCIKFDPESDPTFQ